MNGIAPAELIADLEVAARVGSPERRTRMLRCAIELFVSVAPQLGADHVQVFDDVLLCLLDRTDIRGLAELSNALAGVSPGPHTTIRRLAHHENPAVAAPLLSRCPQVTDADLIDISRHRGQQHLAAISSRQPLSEAVTEAVLKHAGKDALRLLARNPAARFTSEGYAALLTAAERDDVLAEALGSRVDLPSEKLQNLLSRTTETVRARLLKSAAAPVRERTQAILSSAAKPERSKTQAASDLAEAKAAVVVLNKGGKLNDSSVNRFAIRREYPNVIAALSLLSGGAVEVIASLMEEDSGNGLIIACRGSRLNWQTTAAILINRRVPPLSNEQLEQAKEVFEMLYVSAAQYTIRFEPLKPEKAAARESRAAAPGGDR